MAYLQEALSSSFEGEPSPQIRGRLFEHALKQALRVHPGEWGRSRFKDVWSWRDWPEREQFGYSAIDPGVDLVALNNDDWGGGYAAIQAKYGLSDITTQEVDSFLAGSGNSNVFQDRILVADRRIATNGENKLEKAIPRVQILRLREIDSWVPDWREVIPEKIADLTISFVKHELREYQQAALEGIKHAFTTHDRGKLILPCGTGKSFVALRAAEQNAGVGGTVLYLVPSISLMGQTMREWSRHRAIPHQYVGICSDITTGRSEDLKAESYAKGQFSELAMPVTTEQAKITQALAQPVPSNSMRVVFSTYQSSRKVMAALKDPALSNFSFDLAICDEAHRTTGIEVESVTSNKPESKPFQLIHNDQYISATKRLYMTATPRVFAENVKKRMIEAAFDGQSYSMDDEETYGKVAYRMSFADAIDQGWLSDYRVVVIGVAEEDYLKRAGRDPITFEDGKQVDPGTVVRLAGCWDALATPGSQELNPDRNLGELALDQYSNARSAIAFTTLVKDSVTAQKVWKQVANWHHRDDDSPDREYLSLEVSHLEAKTPASDRNILIDSLRDASEDGKCRVLTNVGVLSEGVDVPALDAVIFLQSRSSPVDVTQAIGRVMRKAEGKDFGYVIIPVVVPTFNVNDSGSVEDLINASDFKPVWDIIRALRSHDDRIDHMLEARTMPVVLRIPTGARGSRSPSPPKVPHQRSLFDVVKEFNQQFGSIMLEKCGDRHMYPNWGKEAGRVCHQIEVRLTSLFRDYNDIQSDFFAFHESLQNSVSPDITLESTIRMVAQHLVTVPVFDELFSNSMFAERNPITQSMKRIKDSIEKVGVDFDVEREPLARAYRMMNTAFQSADDPSTRLDVLRAIFDGFFRQAMPDEVKTMGIAYTPIELVDFIIKFTDQLCRKEFARGLTDRDVHILDPFVGTGTFIAHLLECVDADGNYIIRDDDLNRKYINELHANELVLLAYYIAALKIEETKHRRSMQASGATNARGLPYEQFEHIVLTDTFHILDTERKNESLFGDLANNNDRASDQINAPIRVIVGNPPWSAGKDDASENMTKTQYPKLAKRISETYVQALRQIKEGTISAKSAGNLYVSAFRWATDRLLRNDDDLPSIVAFVTPNSLSDGTSLAGMRKMLRDEFTSIYVVNLRGNAYKAGEERRMEGKEVFGQATRNGVQITFLVRNPMNDMNQPAELNYAIVPEYLGLEDKFTWLAENCSVDSPEFKSVPINRSHDWVDLQNPDFEGLLEVCKPHKDSVEHYMVESHAGGILTALDTYLYAFSRDDLEAKVRRLIDEFNNCVEKYVSSGYSEEIFEQVTDSTAIERIKWSAKLKSSLRKGIELQFNSANIHEVLYRPFVKCFLYIDWNILAGGKTAVTQFQKKSEIANRNRLENRPPPPYYTNHHHFSLQQSSPRVSRNDPPTRPMCNRNSTDLTNTLPHILTSSGNNMRIAVVATNVLPDLASIQGSQTVRLLPYLQSR